VQKLKKKSSGAKGIEGCVGPRTGLGAEESNHNCPAVQPIANLRYWLCYPGSQDLKSNQPTFQLWTTVVAFKFVTNILILMQPIHRKSVPWWHFRIWRPYIGSGGMIKLDRLQCKYMHVKYSLHVSRSVGKACAHTATRNPCRTPGLKVVAVSFRVDSFLLTRILLIRYGDNNANDYWRRPDYRVAGWP
jgi:hypothetical protein